MKFTFDIGTIDILMLIPSPTCFLDRKEKRVEIGIYFLSYFVTLNINYK